MSLPRRLPFGLSIEGIFQWVWRLLALGLLLGIIYLKSIFATTQDFLALDLRVVATEKTQTLVAAKIETVERTEIAQMEAQRQLEKTLVAIQADLSAVRATQKEAAKNTEKNFDRIFNKLDGMNR